MDDIEAGYNHSTIIMNQIINVSD